jgi:hypothetical protein
LFTSVVPSGRSGLPGVLTSKEVLKYCRKSYSNKLRKMRYTLDNHRETKQANKYMYGKQSSSYRLCMDL